MSDAPKRTAVVPGRRRCRRRPIAPSSLVAGLAVAAAATVFGGVYGPFTGATRAALAVLLLAGWIGLTVAGSLLHLLAILGRIRCFALAMPRPRPWRDRALTVAAGLAVATLALSQAGTMVPLRVPAAAITLAVAAILGARVIVFALRALAPRRVAPS